MVVSFLIDCLADLLKSMFGIVEVKEDRSS